MAQHFRHHHEASDSICGTNMVGQRTPLDMDDGATTCIACVAILAGKPLYGITSTDEDGNIISEVFNTPREQMEAAEEAFKNGALIVTMQIRSVDDLKMGEW